ncbi:hypothetical protein QBC34DRAFT_124286 [Podospora aff. communis PSN243]|uniref:Secreted protein n=1 Tax=Podospora aff. communis PSN243 TaxID=3040156 RepID=A0AAV9GHV6_9PEZI|nr:hypothetical protein QBC34DRAFT_124286 [Podospora aff. communis PSN243]
MRCSRFVLFAAWLLVASQSGVAGMRPQSLSRLCDPATTTTYLHHTTSIARPDLLPENFYKLSLFLVIVSQSQSQLAALRDITSSGYLTTIISTPHTHGELFRR